MADHGRLACWRSPAWSSPSAVRLASGWLGLAAGGRADTTIIVLDRSPSMQQRGAGGGESKLATGVRQLAQTLATLKSAHWVVIDSVTKKPMQLDSPEALLTSPLTEADQCRVRSAGPARSGLRIHPSQQIGPDRHLDLLRSPTERLESGKRSLAGHPRIVALVAARNPDQSAGLSRNRLRAMSRFASRTSAACKTAPGPTSCSR